jgi:hypothetical protein
MGRAFEMFATFVGVGGVVIVIGMMTTCASTPDEARMARDRDARELRETCLARGGSIVESFGDRFHCLVIGGKGDGQ